MRQVNMLDLQAEYKLFAPQIRKVVDQVLESQQFINGPAVGELEKHLAVRIGAKHAIAISNGTDSLLCALMTLGLSRDDEVIVPSFTFFATAGAVVRAGAKPVFVDINPNTFNIEATRIQEAITPNTRAIIVVDLFGQCADVDDIESLARDHNLTVIEDAAQAIGASYKGRQAGTLGNISSFSFYPTKNLGGFGEGGLITTNDDALGRLCRQLRNHGETERYVHEYVGANFRLDTMKAAILLTKLPFLDEFTKRRRRNAEMYNELLRDLPVTSPAVLDECEHVYHQYSILCDRRDDLRTHLTKHGIGTGIYYPVPLHLQKCFANLGYRAGDLPVTEEACRRIVSLPCHPMLSEADVQYVAEHICAFYDKSTTIDAGRTVAAGR